MRPTFHKLHLHAADGERYLGCETARYRIPYYTPAQQEKEWTRYVELVTCASCIKDLIEYRDRPTKREKLRYEETVVTYVERQTQLYERLETIEKMYAKFLKKRMAYDKKQTEARRQRKIAQAIGKSVLLGEFVAFKQHEYSGEDYSVDPAALREALTRSAGNVDCDEFTLALRMARGRNLENESLWFVLPGSPINDMWTARYRTPEEYWPWDD